LKKGGASMVLTKKEKKILIALLRKEKSKLFGTQKHKREVSALLEKMEQSMRNEDVNMMRSSKL
jgi:predicted RNA-binding protein (virulence factor B family)